MNMATFGRAVQTGTIWLTAMMTLIAGIPHFVCRCPNGNVKPFCLALLSAKTACCRDGSCCSASPADDETGLVTHVSPSTPVAKKTCCCRNADREDAGSGSRTEAQFKKAGCQRVLAAAAVAISESSVKASLEDFTAHLFLPAPEPIMGQDGFGACDSLSAYHSPWSPPSTDLVTLLQRFLI
ncbi:MAG: hypothetical protein ACYC3I_14140 [Gemmataceae bacterium]